MVITYAPAAGPDENPRRSSQRGKHTAFVWPCRLSHRGGAVGLLFPSTEPGMVIPGVRLCAARDDDDD